MTIYCQSQDEEQTRVTHPVGRAEGKSCRSPAPSPTGVCMESSGQQEGHTQQNEEGEECFAESRRSKIDDESV